MTKRQDEIVSRLGQLEKMDPFRAIEYSLRDAAVIDRDGYVSEPYRTFHLLRLVGKRPLMVLRIIDLLRARTTEVNNQDAGYTRSEIARKLGKDYQSGTPYMELGKYLRSLVSSGCTQKCTEREKQGGVYNRGSRASA